MVRFIDAPYAFSNPDAYDAELSFRLNTDVACEGDSRLAQGTSITATEYSKMSQGIMSWAQYFSRHRFTAPIAYNFAVSGQNTRDVLGNLDGHLATCQAAIWVVLIGTNDWSAGFTALGSASSQGPGGTDSIVNLDAIVKKITKKGRFVLLVAELPRGNANNTAQRLSASNLLRHLKIRDYVLSLRFTPGVYIIDPSQYLTLANSATGDSIITLFKDPGDGSDGLHPNEAGAAYIGLSLSNLLNSILPPVDVLPQSNADQYDAALFPKGLLNTNPIFDGTAGTLNAGGSGSLGTGWSENSAPGFTRVYSQPTIAGKKWQQVVLGGTATSTGLSIRQVISAGKLAIGDRVQVIGEVETDTDLANVVAVSLQLLDNNAITAGDMRPASTAARVPVFQAMSGIQASPIYTLTSTVLQLQCFIQVAAGSNPLGTIRFRNVGLRKVV